MGKVFYRKTEDRRSFIKEILQMFSSESYKTKNAIVNLNLASNEPYPTTTHPEVLLEVLSFFRGKNVSVVASPAIDSVIREKIPSSHPLRLVAKDFGLDIRNLNLMRHRKRKAIRMSFELADINYDDVNIVSLPVLKAHKTCKISCALEIQLGFLSVKEKFWLYTKIKDIHSTIAEVNFIVRPRITIVDAIEVMVKADERRHGGKVKFLGYMMAGKDPVSVDSFCLELMKEVDPNFTDVSTKDIRYLRFAEEVGIGTTAYDAIEI